MYYIGIDPGTKTGVAVWDSSGKCFVSIETLKIHDALDFVLGLYRNDVETFVYFEDARQRTWFAPDNGIKRQGAGSIKRDCSIWEDFLNAKNIPFVMVAPKNNRTKMNPEQFKRLTDYPGRTSEHGRDAAMLVFGR